MRIVVSWLRELCPTDLPADEIAERIIANGVHVEEILRPWDGLSGVIAARVVEKHAHPNADRLTLATLDTGGGAAHVAAGVANWEVGDVVPYAPPGSRVPALDQPLGVRTLKGEPSEGMICSPHELAISDDHGAILLLPPDTPPGTDVAALIGLTDAVFDIEIEPNRPDLMSVLGVAREVSAATGVPLVPPDVSVTESLEPCTSVASVEVRDAQRCPRYVARVIRDVRVRPAPLRAQARLFVAGMRPISNVVDATNYVLLELGQPLHPFDLRRLDGEAIVVRRAAEGEAIVTLDDVQRRLTAEDLVIADRAKAVGIAGVMGAAPAEVDDATTDVLLESAYFEPAGIIRTSRRLKLSTEASQRFERGCDPETPGPAAARAARLIAEWAGGRVLGSPIDVGSVPERHRLSIRPSRASFFLAEPVGADEVRGVFDRLGMASEQTDAGEVEVEVPGYRIDLRREVDLIEEVARIRGYARLPSRVPCIATAGGFDDTYAFRRRLREAMLRGGLREMVALSFASPGDLGLMGHDEDDAVRVANPIDAERGFLRTSLVPGLVRALRLNLDRQRRSAALFEVGHVFRVDGELRESERAAFAMAGPAWPGYPGERREFDVFDAKGALEAVLGALGVDSWHVEPVDHWPLHPGRSARVLLGDDELGWFGELHPRAARDADMAGRVAAAELDVDALRRHASHAASAADVPRFPPARRDLSFVVGDDVPAARVAGLIGRAGGDLVDAVTLFDVFSGDPLPEGRKNLGFSVDFRAPDRTLTDAEVDAAVTAVRDLVAHEVGGELRTG
ncbi:MAG TPA: phenylalanine--tRNA ligase subunit beta [Actinomycetota bacterium]